MDKPADLPKSQNNTTDAPGVPASDSNNNPTLAPTDVDLPKHTSEAQDISGYGDSKPDIGDGSDNSPSMKVEVEKVDEGESEPIKLNAEGEKEDGKETKPELKIGQKPEQKMEPIQTVKPAPISSIEQKDDKSNPIPSTPPPNSSQSSIPLGFAGKTIPTPPPIPAPTEVKKPEPTIKFDDEKDDKQVNPVQNTVSTNVDIGNDDGNKNGMDPAPNGLPKIPGVGKPMVEQKPISVSPPSIPMAENKSFPTQTPSEDDKDALKSMNVTPPPPGILNQDGGDSANKVIDNPPPFPTPQNSTNPSSIDAKQGEKKPNKEKKAKKGGKGKKIIMGVLGFVVLLAGAAAGYYYYTTNIKTPEVAVVGTYCVASYNCPAGHACDTSTNTCRAVSSTFCPDDYGAWCNLECENYKTFCIAWSDLSGGCYTYQQQYCGSSSVGGSTTEDYCDNTGCDVGSDYPTYWVTRYHCDDLKSGEGCQTNNGGVQTGGPAQSLGFIENCGTEQIDVAKDGVAHVDSQSRVYQYPCGTATPRPSTTTTPTPTPTPTPSTAPTVVCNTLGYQQARTTIEVGQQINLFCNAEASNGSALTYDFRYRVDSGVWQSMVADGFNSSLVVDEEGHYEIECRACMTYNGSTMCSAQWSQAQ